MLKVTVGGLRRLNKQVETPGVGRVLKVAVGGLPRLTEQKSFTMWTKRDRRTVRHTCRRLGDRTGLCQQGAT